MRLLLLSTSLVETALCPLPPFQPLNLLLDVLHPVLLLGRCLQVLSLVPPYLWAEPVINFRCS